MPISVIQSLGNALTKYSQNLLKIIHLSLVSAHSNHIFRLTELSFLVFRNCVSISSIFINNSFVWCECGLFKDESHTYIFGIESMNKILNKERLSDHCKWETSQKSELKPFLSNAIRVSDTDTVCNLLMPFCEAQTAFLCEHSNNICYNACLSVIEMCLAFTQYSSIFGWLWTIFLCSADTSHSKETFLLNLILQSMLLHSRHCDEFDKYAQFEFRVNSKGLFISVFDLSARRPSRLYCFSPPMFDSNPRKNGIRLLKSSNMSHSKAAHSIPIWTKQKCKY